MILESAQVQMSLSFIFQGLIRTLGFSGTGELGLGLDNFTRKFQKIYLALNLLFIFACITIVLLGLFVITGLFASDGL